MRTYACRHVLLLIDFDDCLQQRAQQVRDRVPGDVADRVYVLGSRSEPERLRVALGQSLDRIGTALAGDCADGWLGRWSHDLLVHNQPELDRMTEQVRPFLFRQ
jgi:hypothetical protein